LNLAADFGAVVVATAMGAEVTMHRAPMMAMKVFSMFASPR
jgi:hypothetical protein